MSNSTCPKIILFLSLHHTACLSTTSYLSQCQTLPVWKSHPSCLYITLHLSQLFNVGLQLLSTSFLLCHSVQQFLFFHCPDLVNSSVQFFLTWAMMKYTVSIIVSKQCVCVCEFEYVCVCVFMWVCVCVCMCVCVCLIYICIGTEFVDLTSILFFSSYHGEKRFEMCLELWQCLIRPGLTPCDWQDVNIQLLCN